MCLSAVRGGLTWLLGIQNEDGGIPTFCRGWNRLAFDRSCPDITAHTLRAFVAWNLDVEPALRSRLQKAQVRGLDYLARTRRDDGAWIPLWFGSQWTRNAENPTYGTAQVVTSLQDMATQGTPNLDEMVGHGRSWLCAAQNPDGGWGGDLGAPSSVEETALAVRALTEPDCEHLLPIRRGVSWLLERIADPPLRPAPIGLYFASLWYSEKSYPLVFSVAALTRVAEMLPTDALGQL